MSRYLFFVPPLTGHILPAAAVAGALADRGHEVAWVGSQARLRPFLRADATVYPTGMRLFRGQPDTGMTAIKSLWEGFIVPFARFTLPAVEQAVAAFGPDVLVSDEQALAGPLVARRHGLPWATLCPATLGLAQPFRRLPKVEAWISELKAGLATEAGLGPGLNGGLEFSPHLVIVFADRALIGDRPYPGHYAFVGPALAARPAVEFPWDWLDPARSHVLVTVGTMADAAATGFYRRAVEALRPLAHRVQAIVVAPPQTLPGVPEHVLVRPRVPMLELLPRLDAAVCHGGTNTVSEALRYAVPLVVAPLTRDQPVNAAHVVRAGVGIRVHFDRVRPEALRAAVLALLDDPSYRAAAGQIRESSAAAGGAAAAAARLEDLHAQCDGSPQ
jgi:zeaxanthin glucosyltransferase